MTLAERVSAFLNPPHSAVIEPETKAMTGAGAYVLEYHEPLARTQRNPMKYQRYCQAISRKNPWVNTAEAIISGKASTVEWHLEDANDETVDPVSSPQAKVVQTLFERPNPQMTRSRLWSITLRHMGVCGNAFWFLDQLDGLAKTPQAIYYINPARMRPATDSRGNLTGWILDSDENYEFEYGSQTGIGLKLEEVIHFTMEPPDWGYLGHGLVEAAENLLALNGAAERYLTQVLATGGRRGHFIGPKDGRMDDDVFQSLVAGLRNVAESPDAAKRNIVTKGPLEATPQAVTPNEVGAMGVLTEMRENIVSGVWRVPLSELGIPLPHGLNSGESRKYDAASLWQNAIEPRLKPFSETLQFQLLDRWAALGLALNIVLETPEFDDQMPAWDLLDKSTKAPITWNEQRALVGLDPLPDYGGDGQPLGLRITLPKTLVEVAAGPDEHGNFKTPPTVQVTAPETALLTPGKAVIRAPFAHVRDRLGTTLTPKLTNSVTAFLAEQKAELVSRLRGKIEHLLRKPSDASWWNQTFWDDRLGKTLTPGLRTIATAVSSEATNVLGPRKADDEGDAFIEDVLSFIESSAGKRITGMNETTRDAILAEVRSALEQAVEDGLGPEEAADLLSERVGGLAIWSDSRADMIARTELMNAYNDAALRSYERYDVGKVQALDGDYDPTCADRNGQIFDIDEAYGISDHPNGTLDWAPIKANVNKAEPDVRMAHAMELYLAEQEAKEQERQTREQDRQAKADADLATRYDLLTQMSDRYAALAADALTPRDPPQITNIINVPDQPAPIVNVAPTPPVVVPAPIVNVPEAPKRIVKSVMRDSDGTIIGSVEDRL